MLKDCNAMVREWQVQKYDHFPGIQAAKKRIKMTLSAFIDHLHFFGERVSKPEIVYTSDVWGMHILAISNISSIHVHHFWKHAKQFCSTWMTSQMHIEKGGVSHFGLVFSVCSFAHLLCVCTTFEQYFDIPFFFYLLTCTVRLHPFIEIPVQND